MAFNWGFLNPSRIWIAENSNNKKIKNTEIIVGNSISKQAAKKFNRNLKIGLLTSLEYASIDFEYTENGWAKSFMIIRVNGTAIVQ